MHTDRTRYEREVTTTFNEEEAHAVVWSCSPMFIRKMKKACLAHGIEPVRQENESYTWHVPRAWVAIRPPKKMNLTDEQKAERGERMRNLRRTKS